MSKFKRRALVALCIAFGLFLLPGLIAVAWAVNTTLTNTAVWCASVSAPSPGDPVSAGSGTGGIRTALQCLANRTYSLMSGTVTLAGITLDGIGGAATTPSAGAGIAPVGWVASGPGAADNVVDTTNGGISALHSYNVGFVGITDGAVLGGNPVIGTGLTNDLRPINIVKSYGHMTTNGTGVTSVGGANFGGSPAGGFTTTGIKVALPASMKDTSYTLVCSASITGSPDLPVTCSEGKTGARAPAAGYFWLVFSWGLNTGSAPLDPTSVNLDISYILMGIQDS